MNRRTALKSILALPAVASGQIPAERVLSDNITRHLMLPPFDPDMWRCIQEIEKTYEHPRKLYPLAHFGP